MANIYHIDVKIIRFLFESLNGLSTFFFVSLCYFLCLFIGSFREITHKRKGAHTRDASLWAHKRLNIVTGILKEGRHIIKYIFERHCVC